MKRFSTTAFAFIMFLILLLSLSARAQELPFTVQVSGKGSPMIFIPGYTCSGEVWNATAEHFSAGHECHVITVRGFGGEAPSAKNITLNDVKDGIKTYISRKKLQHVILVGHSMGGYLAQLAASEMKSPEIDGVVIVDAVPFIGALSDSSAQGKGFDSTAAANMETMIRKQTPELRLMYGKMTASQLCLDTTKHAVIGHWSAVSDPHTCAWLIMEMAGTDLRGKIASITVPVLVLSAWEKGYGVPMESIQHSWSRQYAAVKNLSFHMVPGSRHFIMYDAPETFYSELNTFITRCGSAVKE